MLWQWPFALIHYGQGYVATKRMQAFLLHEEMSPDPAIKIKPLTDPSNNQSIDPSIRPSIVTIDPSIECDKNDEPRIILPKDETKAISLTDITSKWIAGSNRNAGIYNATLNIASGELCAIIGPVGSGL